MNCWQASVAENDFVVGIGRPAPDKAVNLGRERRPIDPMGLIDSLMKSAFSAASHPYTESCGSVPEHTDRNPVIIVANAAT
ncbi:MAG: hypothetical protein ACI9PX_000855 [Reinekea sp.]|jgi:hypothetical protein